MVSLIPPPVLPDVLSVPTFYPGAGEIDDSFTLQISLDVLAQV